MKAYFAPLTILAFLSLAAPSHPADLFRWEDERGIVHFTDNLHNIPEKFRAGATQIKSIAPPKVYRIPVYPDKASIPLKLKGRTAVVEAVLNDRTQGNFIVDTGASFTVVSRATAEKLGIDLDRNHPKISLQTANGVIEAPLVTLDSMEVGGMRVDDLRVTVHDFSQDSSISGLLGLNFLSHFRVDLDTENEVMVLEKK